MKVLSLFDGKSSGFTAMELAGIPVTEYYSSEVDKHAIKVSDAIHPNQIRLGDVTNWREWDIDWESIDLILGGFPCQAWSVAGKQMGDKDERGMLFWTMLDIMKHVRKHNSKAHFLIENVKMKKEFEEYITFHMNEAVGDVHKILINSKLVSAQNRERYYWTSFSVTQPEDEGILLYLILDELPDCHIGVRVREKSKCLRVGGRNSPFGSNQEWDSPFQRVSKKGKVKKGIDKASCLTGGANSGGNHSDMDIIHSPEFTRRYSTRECFRLQSVPEHYIDKIISCGVSNTQLYKIAGNGWTDEVIAHILRHIK